MTGSAEVHPGARIALLVLVLAVLAIGGVVWFDYLGVIDARAVIRPVGRLLGLPTREPVAQAEDPNLLEKERLAKEQEATAAQRQDLERIRSELSQQGLTLTQVAESLSEREQAIADREKAFSEQQQAYENKRVNLEQVTVQLSSMPPQSAVNIMLQMTDQDVIDVVRLVDQRATEAGEISITPYWLSLMPADRAATIQRKMQQGSGG